MSRVDGRARIAMDNALTWLGICLLAATLAALLWGDWVRLMRPSVRVQAQVIGHRTGRSEGAVDYAAIYRFTADGTAHEVVDGVYSATPRPAIGAICTLEYPAGRPDLARPPRRMLWVLIYALLLGMAAVLLAKVAG